MIVIMWMNTVSQFRDKTLKLHADQTVEHFMEVSQLRTGLILPHSTFSRSNAHDTHLVASFHFRYFR